MTDKRPQTANDVLRQVDEDHEWTHNPADNSTTPGIQRTLERHRVAIQRLADFIDGKRDGEVAKFESVAWYEPAASDVKYDPYKDDQGKPTPPWQEDPPPAPTAPDTVGP